MSETIELQRNHLINLEENSKCLQIYQSSLQDNKTFER
jgi:hypothetical protein